MKLIAQLKELRKAEDLARREALQDYRDVIFSASGDADLDAKAVAKLNAAMQKLGITLKDVANDYAALEEYRELSSVADDQEAAHAAAMEATGASVLHAGNLRAGITPTELAKHRATSAELQEKARTANNRVQRTSAAATRMRDIEENTPRLWGVMP